VPPTELRIRDVYPGSCFFPARIPDPTPTTKEGDKFSFLTYFFATDLTNGKYFIFEQVQNIHPFKKIKFLPFFIFGGYIGLPGSTFTTVTTLFFPDFCGLLTSVMDPE
jgi:hypothetical protein